MSSDDFTPGDEIMAKMREIFGEPKWFGLDHKPLTTMRQVDALMRSPDKILHVHRSVDELVRVSTVFLVMDHAYPGEPGPVLYETMVFAEPEHYADTECWRYRTKDEALARHWELAQKYRCDVDVTHEVKAAMAAHLN